MLNFKYRYCKTRMVAFLHHELQPRARQRVARYIDECPRCYQEYIEQREIQRQLQADIPLLGYGETAQLRNIWSAVEQELSAPSQPRRVVRQGRFRYGLVMVALLMALFVPMIVGADSGTKMKVTPATPGQKVSVVVTNTATTDDTDNVRLNVTHATVRGDVTDTKSRVIPEAARTPDANN